MKVTAVHDDGSITQRPEVVPFYAVRFLGRQELGTAYPKVAKRLAWIVAMLERDFPDSRVTVTTLTLGAVRILERPLVRRALLRLVEVSGLRYLRKDRIAPVRH